MTNRELTQVVCDTLKARREQGTPFSREAFVALVKMVQALFPQTTAEHQIDVTARMKVIADPLNGFHPSWEDGALFAACLKAVEDKPKTFAVPFEEAIIFVEALDMALKRLAPNAEACPCLTALSEKL